MARLSPCPPPQSRGHPPPKFLPRSCPFKLLSSRLSQLICFQSKRSRKMTVGVPSPGPVRVMRLAGQWSPPPGQLCAFNSGHAPSWGGCGALALHWGAPAPLGGQAPPDSVRASLHSPWEQLGTKVTSGHPSLPPALCLAPPLGWHGGQASETMCGQRSHVQQLGLKGEKSSSPRRPRDRKGQAKRYSGGHNATAQPLSISPGWGIWGPVSY